MISSPGQVCLTNGVVGPRSTRALTTSCPGTLRLCCWRSVRLMSGCWAAMPLPPSDLSEWIRTCSGSDGVSRKEARVSCRRPVRLGHRWRLGADGPRLHRRGQPARERHVSASAGTVLRHHLPTQLPSSRDCAVCRRAAALGAATNDCHTNSCTVHDLNSSARTRICHKAAPGRYRVGGERASPCGGRHAAGSGPRRRGFRRQCRPSDERQCRARVRHPRRLGRRGSLDAGTQTPPAARR
jgi:hypothetical protein